MTKSQWRLLAETVKEHGFDASATALLLARFHTYLAGIGFGLRAFVARHPVEIVPLMAIPPALTITGQMDTAAADCWGVYHYNGGVRPTMILDTVAPGPRLEEVFIHECLHHVDFSGDRTYLLGAHSRLVVEGKVPDALRDAPHEFFAQTATDYILKKRKIDECHAQVVRKVLKAAGLGL